MNSISWHLPTLQRSYRSSDPENPRQRETLSQFLTTFQELLREKNFRKLFKLTERYQEILQHQISLREDLKELLPLAKTKEDFDQIRRLAIIDEMFNPNTLFSRLCQAYCYHRTGNDQSTKALLKNVQIQILSTEVVRSTVRNPQLGQCFLVLRNLRANL